MHNIYNSSVLSGLLLKMDHFPVLRSLISGFAIYKGVSLFSSYFNSGLNPEYEKNKIHYDAAISLVASALTGSSISVNLLFLADHYIRANNFFTDETKRKYHLQYALPAIGFVATFIHTQELNMASKLLFKHVIGPVVGFGYSNVAKPTVSATYTYLLAPAGKAAFAATKYCLSTCYSAAFKSTSYVASNYVLPVFYAKCATILSTGTIGALGYIGLYFVAPIYLVNKAANQQTMISNWSLDKACLVLSMKEGRNAEENAVVEKYKAIRHSSMNLEGAVGRNLNHLSIYGWLNSSYVDQDGYNKFSELQKYIDLKNLNLGQMTETDKNRDFLNSINTNSSRAGLAYIATGTAGLAALFAPAAFAIPLVLAAACTAPFAAHYTTHINARYAGEIHKLLNPVAPAPDHSR